VLLCSFHHRLVHEGGFSIALTGTAEVEVRTPKGTCLPAVPALAPDAGAIDWSSDWWGDGPATVTAPAWDGEPADYDAAVDALCAA
jgi:hypothetical protein